MWDFFLFFIIVFKLHRCIFLFLCCILHLAGMSRAFGRAVWQSESSSKSSCLSKDLSTAANERVRMRERGRDWQWRIAGMHSIETRPEREEGIGKERQSDRQAERKNRLKPTKKQCHSKVEIYWAACLRSRVSGVSLRVPLVQSQQANLQPYNSHSWCGLFKTTSCTLMPVWCT